MVVTVAARPSHPRLAPTLAAVAIAGLLTIAAVGFVDHHYGFVADRTLLFLTAVAYGSLGPWVWARAVPLIGQRMSWVALAAAVNLAAQGWSSTPVGAWASRWTWLLPVLLVPLALSRFPDGRAPPGRWRHTEVVLMGTLGVVAVALAVGALGAPRTLPGESMEAVTGWALAAMRVGLLGCGCWALAAVTQLIGLIGRIRAAPPDLRGQLLSLAWSLVLTIGGIVGLIIRDELIFQIIAALALPIGVGAAVLLYSWSDLDLLVHRLTVWIVLTGLVVVAVAGIGWIIADLLPAPWVRAADVLAVVVVVLVVDPARRLLTRAISRLLFGHRGTPDHALTVLGRGLGSATAQHSTQELCRSVAATLALPWVGLRTDGLVVAEWGRPTSEPLEVPLTLVTSTTSLLLCPRRAGERFGPADLRVVSAIAVQVGVAVRALTLAEDLQGARDRLVRSREEERKRLRNELHDGLGPALAGVRLQVHSLARVTGVPCDDVEAALRDCVDEISRLVEGLRPAALDAGLAEALRREVERWESSAVTVQLERPHLGAETALPAAIETAAYRIAAEAISNAVRHSGAQIVLVAGDRQTTAAGDVIRLRVRDDGTGVVVPRDGGVGLSSMQSRAEEVGGTLTITSVPGRGTDLQAQLPIGPSPVRDQPRVDGKPLPAAGAVVRDRAANSFVA